MTRRAESVALIPGTCRICGCTEDRACVFVDIAGEGSHGERDPERVLTCWWIDAGKTLCSNPECIAQVPLDELIYLGLEEKVAR